MRNPTNLPNYGCGIDDKAGYIQSLKHTLKITEKPANSFSRPYTKSCIFDNIN